MRLRQLSRNRKSTGLCRESGGAEDENNDKPSTEVLKNKVKKVACAGNVF